MKRKINQTGEIVIYRSKGAPEIEVKLEQDTVWLDAHLIAKLFDIDRTVVVKHINNIYTTRELKENSTCAKIAQVAADGRIRKMNLYNLDMIISVGYRVNSKRASQFRIWATKILKEHLVKGYTINEKRLQKAGEKLKELQETVSFLGQKSKNEIMQGQEQEILNLLADYSATLTLLEEYDKGKLSLVKKTKGKFILEYEEAKKIIETIKRELIARKEAGELFGNENKGMLKGIIGNIYQTFGGKDLYSSLEEKAAHLLYFIIKDHPFTDGNKRIASFLFIYFLDKNNFLYRVSGQKKINDNALTALSLLIAVSDPDEKEKLVRIVTNLISQ
ncbi:MAG TPA: virulence protein RhuM/Fic/DOC family protein [Bacteroidales bacterium]|nr:virulence protein RhuM/Fic/DOC family protein [Bacteroidales bacterium]HRR94130.1 virulence protein RhuM/Fic/DOC family protein [Bacteroidales bacterium]